MDRMRGGALGAEPEPQSSVSPAFLLVRCTKTGLARIVHGAAGLAKAALGLARATDETIADRTRLCRACGDYRHGFCGRCGCLIAGKVRISSEKCPAGKW